MVKHKIIHNIHWEILSRPNPLSGSGFYSIPRDPLRSIFDPPLSNLTGF